MCSSLRPALGSLYSKLSSAGFFAEGRAALRMATQTWETHFFSRSPCFLKLGTSSARAEEQLSPAPQRRTTPSVFVIVIVDTPGLCASSAELLRRRPEFVRPLYHFIQDTGEPQHFSREA